jgi:hypothetical protein
MPETEIHTFPTADVLEILQWKGPGSVEANLWSIHEARLVEAFESVRRAERHGILGALYDSLPPGSRTRFLTAPETARRLFFAPCDVMFLLGALCAEARLLGDRSSLPRSVWTATGDWYIPKGATGPTAIDERFDWTPDQVFRAPMLRNGAPVDLASPYSRQMHKRTKITTSAPFEAEYGRRAVETVREAMTGVAEVSAAASRMTDTFVRTLILERHLNPDSAFTSYSLRWLVGRTTLQLSIDYSATNIANALVHEAIHTILYIVGHTLPNLQDENMDPAYTIRSPWSGNELNPESFAHAVFVWFGLWQFWREAQGKATMFPRDKIAERLDKARRGFEGPDLEQVLDANEAVLAPHVIASTRAMLAEIRRGAFD